MCVYIYINDLYSVVYVLTIWSYILNNVQIYNVNCYLKGKPGSKFQNFIIKLNFKFKLRPH